MTEKTKYTLTPWRAEGPYVFQGPDCIAICDTDNGSPELLAATAALIVRAVNAHADMLAALRAVQEDYRELLRAGPTDDEANEIDEMLQTVDAAIALANGGA